jgi:hypothetical protein
MDGWMDRFVTIIRRFIPSAAAASCPRLSALLRHHFCFRASFSSFFSLKYLWGFSSNELRRLVSRFNVLMILIQMMGALMMDDGCHTRWAPASPVCRSNVRPAQWNTLVTAPAPASQLV